MEPSPSSNSCRTGGDAIENDCKENADNTATPNDNITNQPKQTNDEATDSLQRNKKAQSVAVKENNKEKDDNQHDTKAEHSDKSAAKDTLPITKNPPKTMTNTDGNKTEAKIKESKAPLENKTNELVTTMVVGFDQAIENSKTKVAKYGKDGKLHSVEIKPVDDKETKITIVSTVPNEVNTEVKSPGLQRNNTAPTVVVNFADAVNKQIPRMAKVAEEKKKPSGLVVDFEQAFKENKAQMAKISEEKKKAQEEKQQFQGKVQDNSNFAKMAAGNEISRPQGMDQKKKKPENVFTQQQIKSKADEIVQRCNEVINEYERSTDDVQAATKVSHTTANIKVAPISQQQLKLTESKVHPAPTFVKDKDGKVDFQRREKSPSAVVNYIEAVQKKAVMLAEKAEKKQKIIIGKIKKAIAGKSDCKNVVTKHELKKMEREKQTGLLKEYIRGERYAYNKPKPIKELIKERQKKESEVEKSLEVPHTSQNEDIPVLSKRNDRMTTLLDGLSSKIAMSAQPEEKQVEMKEIKGVDELSECEEKPVKATHPMVLKVEDKRKMDAMTYDEIVDFSVELNATDKNEATDPEQKPNGDKTNKSKVDLTKKEKYKPKGAATKTKIPLDDLLMNLGEDKDTKVEMGSLTDKRQTKANISAGGNKVEVRNQPRVQVKRTEIPLDNLLMDVGDEKDLPVLGRRSASKEGITGKQKSREIVKEPECNSTYPHLAEPVKEATNLRAESKRTQIPLDELLKDFGDDKPLKICSNKDVKSEKGGRQNVQTRKRDNIDELFKDKTLEKKESDKIPSMHTVPKTKGRKKDADPCDIGSEDFCDYLDRLAKTFEGPENRDDKEAAECNKQKTQISQTKLEPRNRKQEVAPDDICDYLEKLSKELDTKKNKPNNSQAARLQEIQETFNTYDVTENFSVKKNGVEKMTLKKTAKITNDDLVDSKYYGTSPILTTQQKKDNLLSALFEKKNVSLKEDIFETNKDYSKATGGSNNIHVYNNERLSGKQIVPAADTMVYADRASKTSSQSKEIAPNALNPLEKLARERGQRRNLRPASCRKEEIQSKDDDNGILSIEKLAKERGQSRSLKPALKENTEPNLDKNDDNLLDIEKLAGARERGRSARPMKHMQREEKTEPKVTKSDDNLIDIEKLAGARGRESGLVVRPIKHVQEKVSDVKPDIEELANDRRQRQKDVQSKKNDDLSWLTSVVKKKQFQEKKAATDEFGDMSWLTKGTPKQKKKEPSSDSNKQILGDISWLAQDNIEKKKPIKTENSKGFGDMSWLTNSNELPKNDQNEERDVSEVKFKPNWMKNKTDIITEMPVAEKILSEKVTPAWLQNPDRAPVVEETTNEEIVKHNKIPVWFQDKVQQKVKVEVKELDADPPKVKPKPQTEPTKIAADITKDWDKAFAEMFDKNNQVVEEVAENGNVPEDIHATKAGVEAASLIDSDEDIQMATSEKEDTSLYGQECLNDPNGKSSRTPPTDEQGELNESNGVEKHVGDKTFNSRIIRENIEGGNHKPDEISIGPEEKIIEAQTLEDHYNDIICKKPVETGLETEEAKSEVHSTTGDTYQKIVRSITVDNQMDDLGMEMCEKVRDKKISEKLIKTGIQTQEAEFVVHGTTDDTYEEIVESVTTDKQTDDLQMKMYEKVPDKKINYVDEIITYKIPAAVVCEQMDSSNSEIKYDKEIPVIQKPLVEKRKKRREKKAKNKVYFRMDDTESSEAVNYPRGQYKTKEKEVMTKTIHKPDGEPPFTEPNQIEQERLHVIDNKKKKKKSKKYMVKDTERLLDEQVQRGWKSSHQYQNTKPKVLVNNKPSDSVPSDTNVDNPDLRDMLMGIAITAHKLVKAEARLNESEERYSRKCKARKEAKAKQVKQRSFSDILDDQIVALVTHTACEPFPEKYRIQNNDDDIIYESQHDDTKYTNMRQVEPVHDLKLPVKDAQRKHHKKIVKNSPEKDTSRSTRHKDRGDEENKFVSVEKVTQQHNDNIEQVQVNRNSSKRKAGKKARRYLSDKGMDKETHQTKTYNPEPDNICCNYGCHSQNLEQQPNGDTRCYAMDTNPSTTHMQSQQKPTLPNPDPMQITGTNIVLGDYGCHSQNLEQQPNGDTCCYAMDTNPSTTHMQSQQKPTLPNPDPMQITGTNIVLGDYGCHSQNLEQQPNGDTCCYAMDTNPSTTHMQSQQKTTLPNPGPMQITGTNIVLGDNGQEDMNRVVWNVKGDFNVQGDFYAMPTKVKSRGVISKFKNAFKKLKLKK